jgi:hypothetical protein
MDNDFKETMNNKLFKILIILTLAGLSSEIYGFSMPFLKKDKAKQTQEKSLKILTLGDSNGALLTRFRISEATWGKLITDL